MTGVLSQPRGTAHAFRITGRESRFGARLRRKEPLVLHPVEQVVRAGRNQPARLGGHQVRAEHRPRAIERVFVHVGVQVDRADAVFGDPLPLEVVQRAAGWIERFHQAAEDRQVLGLTLGVQPVDGVGEELVLRRGPQQVRILQQLAESAPARQTA